MQPKYLGKRKYVTYMINNETKYSVNLDLIKSRISLKGNIGVDFGIPTLVETEFASIKESDDWIEDNELLLVLKYRYEISVCPHQIIVWHEIVNEVVGRIEIKIVKNLERDVDIVRLDKHEIVLKERLVWCAFHLQTESYEVGLK